MAFTAKIVNKIWKNGLLTVEIEYTDGVRTFHDSMVSRSGQAADWVENEVVRRLTDLAGLDTLAESIELGPVAVNAVHGVAKETPVSEYETKLRQFNAWLEALRQGVTTVDRPAFVALKTWLRDNWQDEYLELFLR